MVKTEIQDGSVDGMASKSGRFSAHDCLLAAIQTTCRGQGSIRLEVPDAGHVLIDADQGHFWPQIDCDQTFFNTNSANALIEPEPAGSDPVGSRPIEELLWQAAWTGSNGALLERCQLYDVVSLKHWPNFTRLPHSEHLFPLCSLLAHRPTSMSFAYRMLKVPEPEAFRFFSAATAAGCLSVVSSQPPRSGSEPGDEGATTARAEHGVAGFWGRLFKRISGL